MQEIVWVLSNLSPNAWLDIFIVTLLFFGMTFLFRGTQAGALFRGIVIIFLGLFIVANLFRLQALGWILTNALTALVVAVPVIFQPEIRRALEQIGSGGTIFRRQAPEAARENIIEEIVKASERLSERRHGALIVLQRNSSLSEFISSGVQVNAEVKAELLLTIFWPKTELHDGAVIIDGNGKIASAAAVLPLTATRNLPHPKMGTRHRASIGISEVSDAVCVVVSEETGRISVTNGGRMVSKLDSDRLKTILHAFYGATYQQRPNPLQTILRRLSARLGTAKNLWNA